MISLYIYSEKHNRLFSRATQAKLKQAQKTAGDNAAAVLDSYETTIIQGYEMIKQREKTRKENEKYKNPLELSE